MPQGRSGAEPWQSPIWGENEVAVSRLFVTTLLGKGILLPFMSTMKRLGCRDGVVIEPT